MSDWRLELDGTLRCMRLLRDHTVHPPDAQGTVEIETDGDMRVVIPFEWLRQYVRRHEARDAIGHEVVP